jgi:putative membrane protein
VRLLLSWVINAGTLVLLPYILPGIHVDGFASALWTALVLGLVNTVIRPVLVILTLPVTLVTLGLFILVLNALLFWMVATWLEGFRVDGFGPAFAGAIAYSVISALVSWLLLGDRRS